jgi:hypothetical protein
MVFVVDARSEETHDMHLREAPVAGKFLHDLALMQLG